MSHQSAHAPFAVIKRRLSMPVLRAVTLKWIRQFRVKALRDERASGKTFIADEKIQQEEAWNTGASLSFNIPVAGKNLELNIDLNSATLL